MWLMLGKWFMPLGRWIDSKMSEVAATWELSKTHKIGLGKEKQISQILIQFEYSNFTSISMSFYKSQAPLFIVWEG